MKLLSLPLPIPTEDATLVDKTSIPKSTAAVWRPSSQCRVSVQGVCAGVMHAVTVVIRTWSNAQRDQNRGKAKHVTPSCPRHLRLNKTSAARPCHYWAYPQQLVYFSQWGRPCKLPYRAPGTTVSLSWPWRMDKASQRLIDSVFISGVQWTTAVLYGRPNMNS